MALLGLAFVASSCREVELSSSQRTFVQDAWPAYKKLYLSEAGNVIDPTRNGGQTTDRKSTRLKSSHRL